MWSAFLSLLGGFGIAYLAIPFLMEIRFRKTVENEWGVEVQKGDMSSSCRALLAFKRATVDTDPYQNLHKEFISPNQRQSLIPVVREMSKPLAFVWSKKEPVEGIRIAELALKIKSQTKTAIIVVGLVLSGLCYFVFG